MGRRLVARQVSPHFGAHEGEWYWERLDWDGNGVTSRGFWPTEEQALEDGRAANPDLFTPPQDPRAVTT